MLELNQIYQGDCLEVMKDIDDKSIDMVLADLPYDSRACSWDKMIPLESLWKQYKRIIKDDGAIVLTASQPFTSKLIMSNPDMFKYCWVWVKERGHNFLNFKYQPAKAHEDVVVFSKMAASYSKKGTMRYYPQMEQGTAYSSVQGRAGDAVARDEKTRKTQIHTENKGERYPTSILRFNTEKGLHPTQKPVPLFEYLIKTYTNKSDIVLDNTAGSGTTGVACQNLNRNYILIEKESEYVEICKNRLNENNSNKKDNQDIISTFFN